MRLLDSVQPPTVAAPLRERLATARNADGGWPYAPGKRSRIEPTCWALLARAADGAASGASAVFGSWLRDGARLVDGPRLPPNNVHNALAVLALLQDGTEGERMASPVVDALVASSAITTGPSTIIIQDNTLRGWGWVDGTTSWLEPTAWCVLLLKRLRHRGHGDRTIDARIDLGERLLFDRACRDGGWNYGNAIVYGKELWPYALTTAIALIALQDRRDHPIVRQAVYRLERDARREGSLSALAFATVCLRIYGRPVDALRQQLAAVSSVNAVSDTTDDVLALAMAASALDDTGALPALTV